MVVTYATACTRTDDDIFIASQIDSPGERKERGKGAEDSRKDHGD